MARGILVKRLLIAARPPGVSAARSGMTLKHAALRERAFRSPFMRRNLARFRGDPGGLDFLKKAVGIATSFIPGGGVVKAAVGAAKSFLGTSKGKAIAGGAAAALGAGTLGLVSGFGRGKGEQIALGGLGPPAPGRRRRRMNPMNARAARRAIRRIKSVRKITRDIESMLPRVRSKPRFAFGRKK